MHGASWAALLLWFVGGTLAAQDAPQPEPAVPVQHSQSAAPTRLSDLSLKSVDADRAAVVPTEHFAARSALREFALSPDGRHLAVRRVYEGESDVTLIDADTMKLLKIFKLPEEYDIESFQWAGNDKIIFSISAIDKTRRYPVRFSRLYVRNIRNEDVFMLDVSRRLLWGGEVIHVDDDGEYALVSVQRNFRSFPSVYRYRLVPDGESEQVVGQKTGVWNWHADDAGVIRLGTGWHNRRLRIYYRTDDDGDFELIEKLRRDEEDRSRFWNVLQIVSGSDRGYVLEEDEEGRVGVRLFDYSKGETLETYYANPDWDVDELWLNRDGTPLAALYTDDRLKIEWFDEEWDALYRDLRTALGFEDVHIISRSRNNEKMLIWGGSEADPGALYIFTPDQQRLALLTNYRPELDFRQLTPPVPVKYRARDGLIISAYLALPRGVRPDRLPLIILPHGGPFGVRDMLEYNDEVQLLANRGYAVLQPNYRGSGGYGEPFYEAGRGQIGRAMQDDIDDAMDWAVGEGIADPDRVCVVGSSYGGFAAIWAVMRNPERYRCAASWAGVTDWDQMMSYDRRYLGREAARDLRAMSEGDEEDADLDQYSPVNLASQLSRPLLLAHGEEDQRVPVEQFHRLERATREAPVQPTTLFIEDEGHSFSKAQNEKAWYDALIAFLAEHNPADPGADGEPVPADADAQAAAP